MEIRKYIGIGMLWIAFIYLLFGFAHFVMGNETEAIVGLLAFNIWDVGAVIIFYMEAKENEKSKNNKTKSVGKRRGQNTPKTSKEGIIP